VIEISIIVVVRNEEGFIIPCIKSVEQQFKDHSGWELIVVDGLSTDKTKENLENYLSQVYYEWKILNNPKKILASGWNIGIKEARGTYVLRPDAHATLHPGYISKGIEALRRDPSISVVGGRINAKAESRMGKILKSAISSKVGVGNSPFRTLNRSGFVDTVAYGIYKRSLFSEMGYFDETLIRHQDNDLHRRIHQAKGKFYLSVDMQADYYCRDKVQKLLHQMFSNGYYLAFLTIKSLRLRHVSPLLFYVSLITLFLLGQAHEILLMVGAGIALAYAITILIMVIISSVKNRYPYEIINVGIIPLIHLYYAFGMWLGILSRLYSSLLPRKKEKGLLSRLEQQYPGIISDAFVWDARNWSKATEFWDRQIDGLRGKKGLEIGAYKGGITLLFALNGADMTCSDTIASQDKARQFHSLYNLKRSPKYIKKDVLELDEIDQYDFVVFKSVMGEVGKNGCSENIEKAFSNIHKALKPGGKLFFCENLRASPLHMLYRKLHVSKETPWRSYWNYETPAFYKNALSPFSVVAQKSYGLFGEMGKTPIVVSMLGAIGRIIAPIVPPSARYILFCVATK